MECETPLMRVSASVGNHYFSLPETRRIVLVPRKRGKRRGGN